jgi:hypothetical protein
MMDCPTNHSAKLSEKKRAEPVSSSVEGRLNPGFGIRLVCPYIKIKHRRLSRVYAK